MSLTAKREKFAQEVASGKSQADAYRVAFSADNMKPETIIQAASRLMANSNVSARVAELREPIAKKAQMTLESHLKDLEMLRDKALEAAQYSAAISAEIARGKAAGVHVEKSEQLVTTRELPSSVDDFV